MSATRYRRFLKLCEEWPLDDYKKGRDLGTFLRKRVALSFREGENTQISDPEKCDQMYESLARINSSVYRQRVCAFTSLQKYRHNFNFLEFETQALLVLQWKSVEYFYQGVCNRRMKKKRACGKQ
ncbi:ubiquinol-cytochrome-c reductase complex assembly factor 2 isoform X2 [Takifugu flavidus]|uniref:ubiquinol-cytochrome-c reductase complex assembly factor 2 isoform X2 n=1 Tax=Takifugu flavidus TaxID=433684 RepID=UPI0025446612|nr:ubiquinol-cytochrome-c reductase complex assembly factor 2 isoform X2 [Takifugu flavidus]